MLVQFADLISGLFGLLGAILLGGPAIFSLFNKKRWQQINRLKALVASDPEAAANLAKLREHYLNRVLSPTRTEVRLNVIGYLCLFIAFGFLVVASLHRVAGG